MNSFVGLLFVALVSGSQALKCYDCMDCGTKMGSPDSCSDDHDVCMKVIVGEHVVKRCGEEELCGLGKAERAANRVWTSIVNTFKDVDQDAQLIYCCDDDYCNGGLQNLPNMAVILLPLLFVTIFKF